MGDLVGYAGGFDGGHGVSAAYDRNRSGIFRHGMGDLEGAFGKGWQFENAHGAVPDNGAGAGYLFGKRLDRSRADIEGHHVGRDGLAPVDNLGQGAGFDAVGNDVIRGQEELELVSFRLLQKVAGEFDLVFFDHTLANRFALRLEESVGHTSADNENVNFAEQVLDDSDFVADFGAAQNGDERALGVLQDAAQILQLLFHEQSGGGFLYEPGDANRGSVGPMGGAEGIIDVELGELCELLGKILVILFFFGVEAEVLKQQGLAFLELERHLFGLGPDALGAEADVFAARQFLVEHHAETLGDGFETQLWIRLAFGTAQVRREDEARAVTQSVLDGGQGFADAGVVHDAAVVERDVEVDAHEDATIVERKIANRKFGHGKHSVVRLQHMTHATEPTVLWPTSG